MENPQQRRLAGPKVCLPYHGNSSCERDGGNTASYMEMLMIGPDRIEVLSTPTLLRGTS